MRVPCSRALVSTALSCWFGFLACILGCAQPAVAAAHCEMGQIPGEHLAPANTNNSTSCCHHGRNSSDRSRQNHNREASCCPLDATLIQKQNPVSSPHSGTYIAGSVSFTLYSSNLLSASGEIRPPAIWYTGREILLQAHVLRI
jgi:hypothetical protein